MVQTLKGCRVEFLKLLSFLKESLRCGSVQIFLVISLGSNGGSAGTVS